MEYWAEYVKDADECHFPQSARSNNVEVLQEKNGQLARQTVKIEVEELGLKVWKDFCINWNVAFPTPFKTVWSMVLSRYLGADMLGFFSIMKLPTGRQDVSVVRVLRDEDAPLHELVEKLEKDARRSFPHQKSSLAEFGELPGPLVDGIFNCMIIIAEDGKKEGADISSNLSWGSLAHEVRK